MNERIAKYLQNRGPKLKSEICAALRIDRRSAEIALGYLGEIGVVQLELPSRLWSIRRASRLRRAA